MKIAGSIIVLILVGVGIWYTIQTKPNAEIQEAVVTDQSAVVSDVKNTNSDVNTNNKVASYTIDNAGVKVNFKGFGPGKEHNGTFSKISSNLVQDGSSIKGDVSIDLSSMSSDNEKLTAHLKSKDFFDVEKHPIAKFTAMSLVDGKLTGALSVHGVTKNVSVNVPAVSNGAYTTTFNLNMKEFGIDQKFANETVELTITVPVK